MVSLPLVSSPEIWSSSKTTVFSSHEEKNQSKTAVFVLETQTLNLTIFQEFFVVKPFQRSLFKILR